MKDRLAAERPFGSFLTFLTHEWKLRWLVLFTVLLVPLTLVELIPQRALPGIAEPHQYRSGVFQVIFLGIFTLSALWLLITRISLRGRMLSKVAAAATGIILVVMPILFLYRPTLPMEWRSIAVGMSRDDVIRDFQVRPTDMRELKGFDIWSRAYRFPDSYWQIQVHYDESNHVKGWRFYFIHRGNGFRNLRSSGESAVLQ